MIERQNQGVPAAPSGSRASHEAASASSPEASIPNAVWLVWGIKGEYSDRSEWPVSAYADEGAARHAAVRLKDLSRDLYAIYKQREDELEAAGDWDGETLLTTTEEGRAFAKLHGDFLKPGNYGFDDMEFTCSEVPFFASAETPDTPKGTDT